MLAGPTVTGAGRSLQESVCAGLGLVRLKFQIPSDKIRHFSFSPSTSFKWLSNFTPEIYLFNIILLGLSRKWILRCRDNPVCGTLQL